jgi:hypothetical protein
MRGKYKPISRMKMNQIEIILNRDPEKFQLERVSDKSEFSSQNMTLTAEFKSRNVKHRRLNSNEDIKDVVL